MSRAATAITITDPLVKYHSLLTTGLYQPDAAQYRLAHHLQKLYLRLKDYTPAEEYRSRLQQVTQSIEKARQHGHRPELASPSHPLRRNPLFSRFFASENKDTHDNLALTRVLTSHQAALHVDSPQGLFLSGDVGTGKSMLLDLLADGLPTDRKRRWHFNIFMLHVLSRLEQHRKSHQNFGAGEYALLQIAKDLVETSPILFLDEFQLPDRAASKIMNNLLVAFFQLGGVLIASSNRMPEELEKATGGYFRPPPTGGLIQQALGLGRRKCGGDMFGSSSDFAVFLDVLKARCEFWHMEGSRDWRRRERGEAAVSGSKGGAGDPGAGLSGTLDAKDSSQGLESGDTPQQPAMYCPLSESETDWKNTLSGRLGLPHPTTDSWTPKTLVVYGRRVTVPRQHQGVAYWHFSDLVRSFGPADYLSLASHFHTFVVDHVPVLSLSMKNEARRFITFLDALYESRCKLVIRAAAGPDHLFFPETKLPQALSNNDNDGGDATYSETIAEVFQDHVSPFRPNVSTYADGSQNSKYNPDQDSDFGIVEPDKSVVDFGKTGAFTGEDERFAYKRATSRLWELCSAQWHARGGDWWQPLPLEARHWEGMEASRPVSVRGVDILSSEIAMGPSVEVEEPVGLERFRIARMKKGSD
ncbi:AFG1-like ATPase-domain-containing protein [Schizothecium vesticola]|uniref:AFG1-like ATPase-domain-containing protein n=1 Tax=Schizothecium vesticola TaxID=314040 RepID=A0AA40K1U6_9PEZI|nr:AFG1-like ATPase-domain-containing protein [Schizothecium vesticola]